MAAFAHQQETGQPITPAQLAERMGIPNSLAASILGQPGDATPSPVTHVNGTALNGSRP
jgi:hypothetical protein